MGFEEFGKLLSGFAATTAAKAGEQVWIARLSIDKAGLEKQIEGVYAAMGRYCHTLKKRGGSLSEDLLEYCRDVETLEGQIAALEAQIAQHRQMRDAAAYRAAPGGGEEEQPFYAEAPDIPAEQGPPSDDAPQASPSGGEPCGEPLSASGEAKPGGDLPKEYRLTGILSQPPGRSAAGGLRVGPAFAGRRGGWAGRQTPRISPYHMRWFLYIICRYPLDLCCNMC